MIGELARVPLLCIQLTAAHPFIGVPVSILVLWLVYTYVVPMIAGE